MKQYYGLRLTHEKIEELLRLPEGHKIERAIYKWETRELRLDISCVDGGYERGEYEPVAYKPFGVG